MLKVHNIHHFIIIKPNTVYAYSISTLFNILIDQGEEKSGKAGKDGAGFWERWLEFGLEREEGRALG